MSDILKSNILQDCPYHCTNGKIFIPRLGTMEECPHCSALLKKIAKGEEKTEENKSIYNLLSIPYKYRNIEYDSTTLFPSSVIETTTSQSRQSIIQNIEEISNGIIRGEAPRSNYLFFLGLETDVLPLVFTLLKVAYSKSLKVVPYISTLELIQLYKQAEEPEGFINKYGKEIETDLGVWFNSYCKAEVCIIEVPPSAGENSINIIFSLLKERQKRDLKTIIISETRGISRDLGYYLNNYQDMKICVIESISKQVSVQKMPREDTQQRSEQPRHKRPTNFGVEEEPTLNRQQTKDNQYSKVSKMI